MFKQAITYLIFIPFFMFSQHLNAQPNDNVEFGLELNPVSLLVTSDSFVHVSAGFSLFNSTKNYEINIPLEYKNFKDSDEKFTALNTGVQYRKFLDQRLGGYYLSATSRLTHLNSDTTKLGLGFGFGYRQILPSGLYWGYGVTLGRYIGNNNSLNYEALSDLATSEDHSYMLDVEFLKIGMQF